MTFEPIDFIGFMARFVSHALSERGIEIGPSDLEPIMADLDRALDEGRYVESLYYMDECKRQRQAETEFPKVPDDVIPF